MKKHSLVQQILNIFIISFLFVIPPIFNTGKTFNPQTFQSWNFPWLQIITGYFFLFIYKKYLYEPENDKLQPLTEKAKLLYSSFTVLFTLSLLFFNALIFKFLSILIPQGAQNISVNKPESVPVFVYCLLNFLFGSIYEEVLYRSFLPDSLKNLFNIEKGDVSKRYFALCIEILAALLFAFAHLYAGWLSVLNAVIAHFILRLIYTKSGNLYTNMAAHFLYNLLILFVF